MKQSLAARSTALISFDIVGQYRRVFFCQPKYISRGNPSLDNTLIQFKLWNVGVNTIRGKIIDAVNP